MNEPTTVVEKPSSSVTLVRRAVKADTASLITNGTAALVEDEYAGSYMSAGGSGFTAIIEPTYKPRDLYYVVSHNNTLSQCVEAMEVNIDGTGHSIDLIEGENNSQEDKEKKSLEDFFAQPYPGKTMVGIRRDIRRDIEATGNGYMEIIRNMKKEIMLLNNLDACDMRLIRLDEPVIAKKTIVRDGKEIEVSLRVRERRYVQMVNGKKVYFREFDASRQVNRETGEWETPTKPVPLELQGSEVYHFTLYKEPKSPYGVPRWINQLPSALGSRKAEEFNLEFFDSGGLPPVLVIVQGGYLTPEVKESLNNHLNGSGNKHRAAIVEAISSSGSLESSGNVAVRVERFGSERQQDAMFGEYDSSCEEHIRMGFRLPQMFIGKTSDFNFATAKTAYMVAEAQIFYPERFEFDSVINATIVKSLGAKKYKFTSLPMTLTDVEMQLKGLEMVMTAGATDGEELVSVVNKLTGSDIEYVEPVEPDKPEDFANVDPLTNLPYKEPVSPVEAKQMAMEIKEPPKKSIKKDERSLIKLAEQWATVIGINGPCRLPENEKREILSEVSGLEGIVLKTFNEAVASKSLVFDPDDHEGLAELCGCATQLVR